VPWLPETHGKHIDSFVELLDVYPTIVGLTNLPKPSCTIDGQDMSGLLTDPEASGKSAAFSQYSRCPDQDQPHCAALGKPLWCENNCEGVDANEIASMGYRYGSCRVFGRL
jgi:arylsulfatase A-like enzyme